MLLIKTVGNFLSDEGVVGEFKVKAEIGGPIVVRFPILLIYLAANQYKINAEDKTILFVFLQYVENQCTFLRVGQSSYSKVGLEYIFEPFPYMLGIGYCCKFALQGNS